MPRLLHPCTLALLATFAGVPAMAQDFPTKSLFIVVGPGPDTMARLFGQKMSEDWKQQVLVDPQPAAGGVAAMHTVAKAAPDGHTMLLTTGSYTINEALRPNLPLSLLRDFVPAAEIGTLSFILVTNPNLPFKSLDDVIAAARERPGKLNYASPGNGTPQHVGMELFKQRLGIDIVHVPYKGAAGAMQDLVGGQVEIAYLPVHTALPFAAAGKLRILAVAGNKRSILAPDAPSFKELGFDNMDIELWYGIFGPARLPAEIVAKWSGELAAVLALADVKEALLKQGLVPAFAPPDALANLMRDDVAR